MSALHLQMPTLPDKSRGHEEGNYSTSCCMSLSPFRGEKGFDKTMMCVWYEQKLKMFVLLNNWHAQLIHVLTWHCYLPSLHSRSTQVNYQNTGKGEVNILSKFTTVLSWITFADT